MMRPEVSYFNEKSAAYRAEYDRITPEGYSFRVRREKVLAMVPRESRVLDIASGPGVMVEGLRGKDCRITCVDAAPEMIARAKEEHASKSDVECLVGDAYELPLESGQFDVALAMGLIEYLEFEERFLREAARVLKPNGMFIITFPNYVSPWRACNRFFLSMISALRVLVGKKKAGSVAHREYTARSARKILEQAGFSTESIVYYNFKLVPYPFDVWFPRLTVAQSRLFEHLDRGVMRWLGTGFIVKAKKEQ
ncbi:MAG: hypothetical protein RLZZ416_117 [Candidatus Parcubacteria bacterium]|jgi:ubiquinone/menaquinone biosynthesis C-methylase UbiE